MRVPTGSKILDKMLEGGYEKDVITTIYGPAGSGKTVLAMLCSINMARTGKKIIYIDTENSFSIERLKQIAPDYKKILDNIVFLKPISFEEQKKDFEKLKDLVNDKIGLIVVDTIAMLYRLELGQNEEVYDVNRTLGKQISFLSEIARKKNIPILITNQVYSNFEDKGKVNIVGGDILKYGSKCLIELQITPQNNRRVILKKHRSLSQEKSIYLKIVQTGIIGTREERGFKLF
ncbi:DNA repair and recombination protein RadB [Candidatus Woesearchaeota archaeon B3_Woes]|nr:MAG: DNA repair and recombination protein RadB [Candidatus Woesearchaeota archaeon B3_Woes]